MNTFEFIPIGVHPQTNKNVTTFERRHHTIAAAAEPVCTCNCNEVHEIAHPVTPMSLGYGPKSVKNMNLDLEHGVIDDKPRDA